MSDEINLANNESFSQEEINRAEKARADKIEKFRKIFTFQLESNCAKELQYATRLDKYNAIVKTLRNFLIKGWIRTRKTYFAPPNYEKTVSYLSMEYLTGKKLSNTLIALNVYDEFNEAMASLGIDLQDIFEQEPDAGLGNGGLGRLAACFMDSLSTLEYPAFGYGIRYDYGIFAQKIVNGNQEEVPDNWLRDGNPWEIPRSEIRYLIPFYGDIRVVVDHDGKTKYEWVPGDTVVAMAYDNLIPGFHNRTVNTLRLWSAMSTSEMDLEDFHQGDYVGAVEGKVLSENISKVLYPNDMVSKGRELRLKQEFFFTSASLQDIIRRYKSHFDNFDNFAEKNQIQLNDTHPAIAIAELMRLFLDQEGLDWNKAWGIVQETFGYTNHTIMPEALETWSVERFRNLLPRHLQIIYEINRRFLFQCSSMFPDDKGKMERVSIIKNDRILMANLAIVASHKINGVAKIHSEILKNRLFKDFYEIFPEKFGNKTNGITQRRWLYLCNPGLSNLISDTIGSGWATDLYQLKGLENYTEDVEFQEKWKAIKRKNKERLAKYVKREMNFDLNVDSIIDCQVKRIHEYKRQLLNIMHVIHLYSKLKANPSMDFVPRTFIFGGKTAPAYYMAKLIIKLINNVSQVVNNDPDTKNRLNVLFIPNYSVTLAELIIPAADVSEQVSTAGMEASGTGNMKFSLNGALTVGTLDGANIEIKEEVGDDNIFIFGLKEEEIAELKSSYNPMMYYENNPDLIRVIDLILEGPFTNDYSLFKPIVNSLLYEGDRFFVLADFNAYVECQEKVSELYKDQFEWTRKSIINTANMGKFSSDRTIEEYVQDIWKLKKIHVTK